MDMRHSAYLQAVQAYIQNNNQALEAFASDAQNSRCEVGLIRARQEIKKGQYESALAVLMALSPESILLSAEKSFLLASVHSYESRWQEAALEAHKAIESYQQCKNERGLFLANYNLSVYYDRLGLYDLAKLYVERSSVWARTPSQLGLVLRAQACEHSRRCDFINAVKTIEQAISESLGMDPVDRAALDTVAADIYFRADKPQKALEHLENLAQSKIIRDRARVRFDLIVLRALIEEQTTFVAGEIPKFIEESAEYKLRWKILENLQAGCWTEAQAFWKELSKVLPNRYGENFTCLHAADQKTIFMSAVRSLLSAVKTSAAVKTSQPLSGKLLKLFEILQQSPIHLRKEELIERIWDVSYDISFDARFYKLVERLRREGQVKIEMIKQTYRLSSN